MLRAWLSGRKEKACKKGWWWFCCATLVTVIDWQSDCSEQDARSTNFSAEAELWYGRYQLRAVGIADCSQNTWFALRVVERSHTFLQNSGSKCFPSCFFSSLNAKITGIETFPYCIHSLMFDLLPYSQKLLVLKHFFAIFSAWYLIHFTIRVCQEVKIWASLGKMFWEINGQAVMEKLWRCDLYYCWLERKRNVSPASCYSFLAAWHEDQRCIWRLRSKGKQPGGRRTQTWVIWYTGLWGWAEYRKESSVFSCAIFSPFSVTRLLLSITSSLKA